MKKVIMMPDMNQDETKKPVEFTHRLNETSGWKITEKKPNDFLKTYYLGSCTNDGDMFSCLTNFGEILIFKGHLNSGEY